MSSFIPPGFAGKSLDGLLPLTSANGSSSSHRRDSLDSVGSNASDDGKTSHILSRTSHTKNKSDGLLPLTSANGSSSSQRRDSLEPDFEETETKIRITKSNSSCPKHVLGSTFSQPKTHVDPSTTVAETQALQPPVINLFELAASTLQTVGGINEEPQSWDPFVPTETENSESQKELTFDPANLNLKYDLKDGTTVIISYNKLLTEHLDSVQSFLSQVRIYLKLLFDTSNMLLRFKLINLNNQSRMKNPIQENFCNGVKDNSKFCSEFQKGHIQMGDLIMAILEFKSFEGLYELETDYKNKYINLDQLFKILKQFELFSKEEELPSWLSDKHSDEFKYWIEGQGEKLQSILPDLFTLAPPEDEEDSDEEDSEIYFTFNKEAFKALMQNFLNDIMEILKNFTKNITDKQNDEQRVLQDVYERSVSLEENQTAWNEAFNTFTLLPFKFINTTLDTFFKSVNSNPLNVYFKRIQELSQYQFFELECYYRRAVYEHILKPWEEKDEDAFRNRHRKKLKGTDVEEIKFSSKLNYTGLFSDKYLETEKRLLYKSTDGLTDAAKSVATTVCTQVLPIAYREGAAQAFRLLEETGGDARQAKRLMDQAEFTGDTLAFPQLMDSTEEQRFTKEDGVTTILSPQKKLRLLTSNSQESHL